jgi:hypothetical protein
MELPCFAVGVLVGFYLSTLCWLCLVPFSSQSTNGVPRDRSDAAAGVRQPTRLGERVAMELAEPLRRPSVYAAQQAQMNKVDASLAHDLSRRNSTLLKDAYATQAAKHRETHQKRLTATRAKLRTPGRRSSATPPESDPAPPRTAPPPESSRHAPSSASAPPAAAAPTR